MSHKRGRSLSENDIDMKDGRQTRIKSEPSDTSEPQEAEGQRVTPHTTLQESNAGTSTNRTVLPRSEATAPPAPTPQALSMQLPPSHHTPMAATPLVPDRPASQRNMTSGAATNAAISNPSDNRDARLPPVPPGSGAAEDFARHPVGLGLPPHPYNTVWSANLHYWVHGSSSMRFTFLRPFSSSPAGARDVAIRAIQRDVRCANRRVVVRYKYLPNSNHARLNDGELMPGQLDGQFEVIIVVLCESWVDGR